MSMHGIQKKQMFPSSDCYDVINSSEITELNVVKKVKGDEIKGINH